MISTTQMIGESAASAENSVPAEDARDQPQLAEAPSVAAARQEKPGLDPTRYGDWEKNGRCIDF
jgi:hypothetical protein